MMSSAIKLYWASNHTVHGGVTRCPRLMCADGFSMSVQAGPYHYCEPRKMIPSGDYLAWEVGYPSSVDGMLMAFAEDPSNPTQTVYACVPSETVNTIIEAHGGIREAV